MPNVIGAAGCGVGSRRTTASCGDDSMKRGGGRLPMPHERHEVRRLIPFRSLKDPSAGLAAEHGGSSITCL